MRKTKIAFAAMFFVMVAAKTQNAVVNRWKYC